MYSLERRQLTFHVLHAQVPTQVGSVKELRDAFVSLGRPVFVEATLIRGMCSDDDIKDIRLQG